MLTGTQQIRRAYSRFSAIVQPKDVNAVQYDAETGLYYLNSRYYDPEIGRFLNSDTTDVLEIQDNFDNLNLYAYCNNNPVNCVDPDGTVAIELSFIVTLGVAAIVLCVYIVNAIRIAKTTRTYTFPQIYWKGPNQGLGYNLLSFVTNKITQWVSNSIQQSKGGKQNIRDSGLAGLSGEEISRRANDKSLPKKERERYKKEEKARGLRNKQKRESHY